MGTQALLEHQGSQEKGEKGEKGEPGNPGVDGVKGEKGDLGQKGLESKGCTGRALSVYVSPRGTLTVVENSPVTFRCFALGQPAPIVIWEKEGTGVSFDSSSGALTIAKARVKDSGKYICRAFNTHEMKEATVELLVKGDFGY